MQIFCKARQPIKQKKINYTQMNGNNILFKLCIRLEFSLRNTQCEILSFFILFARENSNKNLFTLIFV